MSSAHRPTWDPAQGKDTRSGSRMFSARDINSQTRLKFRQPGQTTQSEVKIRELKLELLQAEHAAKERKAQGLPGFNPSSTLLITTIPITPIINLDQDDSDSDQEVPANKGKEKELAQEDDEEEESSDDEDEDETAELLRELEKIKRERQEEREKIEREKQLSDTTTREEEIATGNPLLNLQAALGQSGSPTPSMSSTTSSSFGVKRRWDDDVIFKNQARGVSETPKREFVNDLLRTEFHKRFMKKFIA